MTSEVCEHCQGVMTPGDRVKIRGGFSYHKKCHKCYVCSETSLENAEVFKGVIFCASCAQRIFQGCSNARRSKNNGRVGRSRSRSYREGERRALQRRRIDRNKHGVIELAELGASTGSRSTSHESKKNNRSPDSSKYALKGRKGDGIKKTIRSTEIGTATDGAQELMEQINCHITGLNKQSKEIRRRSSIRNRSKHHPPLPRTRTTTLSATLPRIRPKLPFQTLPSTRPTIIIPQHLLSKNASPIPNESKSKSPVSNARPKSPRPNYYDKKESVIDIKPPICSDLRIAELGASTEIANMALRKKSEVPVIIKSQGQLKKRACSISMLQQESDVSGEPKDWLDSAYSSLSESSKANKWLDRRLGSILMMPYNYFRRQILTRDSIISIMISNNLKKEKNYPIKPWKHILRQEIIEHRGRGVKRLYSTINRHKTQYKLGWLQVSTHITKRSKPHLNYRRCKHFKTSHSYRCMRAHVMRLAGPTKSELADIRKRMKKYLAPNIKKIMFKDKPYPAVEQSPACGNESRSLKM